MKQFNKVTESTDNEDIGYFDAYYSGETKCYYIYGYENIGNVVPLSHDVFKVQWQSFDGKWISKVWDTEKQALTHLHEVVTKKTGHIKEGVIGTSMLEALKQPKEIKFTSIGKKPLLMVSISKRGFIELYYIKPSEIVDYFKTTYTTLISQEKNIFEEIDNIISTNRTYATYKLYEL